MERYASQGPVNTPPEATHVQSSSPDTFFLNLVLTVEADDDVSLPCLCLLLFKGTVISLLASIVDSKYRQLFCPNYTFIVNFLETIKCVVLVLVLVLSQMLLKEFTAKFKKHRQIIKQIVITLHIQLMTKLLQHKHLDYTTLCFKTA